MWRFDDIISRVPGDNPIRVQLLSHYARLKIQEFQRYESDPDLAGRLNNLGIKLARRFERTGKMEDLKESIRRAQQAIDITPQDHPDLAGQLNNFGRHLCLSAQPGYSDQAMKSFQNSHNPASKVCFMISKKIPPHMWSYQPHGHHVASVHMQLKSQELTIINVYNPRGQRRDCLANALCCNACPSLVH